MFGDCLCRETHLFDCVSVIVDGEGVRRHRVPMIQMGEFDVNPVGKLETRLITQQLWIVAQLDFVLAQMLDVFLDRDFQVLSQDDQFGRLVDPLIIPSRVLGA